MEKSGGQKAERGCPTRPLYQATWAHLFWPSWPRLRRSFFPKLPRDLKTTIKIVPRCFPGGGGGETQNQKQRDRRLPLEKIRGGKCRWNHLRRSSPSPLRSLHQHHRQDQHHIHHDLHDPLQPPHSLRLFEP